MHFEAAPEVLRPWFKVGVMFKKKKPAPELPALPSAPPGASPAKGSKPPPKGTPLEPINKSDNLLHPCMRAERHGEDHDAGLRPRGENGQATPDVGSSSSGGDKAGPAVTPAPPLVVVGGLGKGGFAVVMAVEHEETGQPFALKVYSGLTCSHMINMHDHVHIYSDVHSDHLRRRLVPSRALAPPPRAPHRWWQRRVPGGARTATGSNWSCARLWTSRPRPSCCAATRASSPQPTSSCSLTRLATTTQPLNRAAMLTHSARTLRLRPSVDDCLWLAARNPPNTLRLSPPPQPFRSAAATCTCT